MIGLGDLMGLLQSILWTSFLQYSLHGKKKKKGAEIKSIYDEFQLLSTLVSVFQWKHSNTETDFLASVSQQNLTRY